MLLKRHQVFVLFLFIALNVCGKQTFQDTIKISIRQADSIFINKNLSLLAEKCNVDAAKALIIQSKVFQNPSIIVNQNVINTEYRTNGGRKWFDFTDKGETNIQIEKLFLLAGKRNKQIKLAELNADREGHFYYDLIRTLKYSLHSNFYNIYSIDQILKIYDKEIVSMRKLIDVSEEEYSKEYISKKELLRLKSALFSLENEKLDYLTQRQTLLSDLNLLLHTSGIVFIPQPDLMNFFGYSPDNLRLQTLIDTALNSRYDLKIAQTDEKISNVNLQYQKALAIPDITISGGWDRNGSFVHNYNYVGLQTDLPLFNRNQGNIKSARLVADNSTYKLQSAEEQVKADVINAYSNSIETNRLLEKYDKTFITDLEILNQEIMKNFEKRNISLIEFLDYYDAYKQNAVQYNKLLYNQINAIETINFSIGKEFIR